MSSLAVVIDRTGGCSGGGVLLFVSDIFRHVIAVVLLLC